MGSINCRLARLLATNRGRRGTHRWFARRWVLQRLMVFPRVPATLPVHYPTMFKVHGVFVCSAILSWLVGYFVVVLPMLERNREIQLEQRTDGGSHHILFMTRLYFAYLVWFIVTRAMHFMPCVSFTAAHLYYQTACCKAACARLLFRDGPACMLVVTAAMLWVLLLRTWKRVGNGPSHIIIIFAIHNSTVGVLSLLFAFWQNRLIFHAMQRGPLRRAAPPDTINSIESRAYDDTVFGNMEGRRYPGQCAICLMAWDPSDRIKITPCQHAFHHDCLASWLETGRTCVLCRQDLVRAIEKGKASRSASASVDEHELETRPHFTRHWQTPATPPPHPHLMSL